MTTEELRIGNWVCDAKQPDIVFTVYGITQDKVMIYPNDIDDEIPDEWISIDEVAPIELNDKWLMILYFENKGKYWRILFDRTMAILLHPELVEVSDGFDIIQLENEIKYVHQLQNLYYSLSGNELPPKQTGK